MSPLGLGGSADQAMKPIKLVKLAAFGAIILIVGTFATGAGSAHTGDTANASYDEEVRIVDKEFVISGGVLTISDTTIEGPGLGDQYFEDDQYTVDSTLRFDGFHVTYDGTHYTICRITVHVQDIGIRLQNVHLTENTAESPVDCDC